MELEALSDKRDFDEIEAADPDLAAAIKRAVEFDWTPEKIEQHFLDRGRSAAVARKCCWAARYLIQQRAARMVDAA